MSCTGVADSTSRCAASRPATLLQAKLLEKQREVQQLRTKVTQLESQGVKVCMGGEACGERMELPFVVWAAWEYLTAW